MLGAALVPGKTYGGIVTWPFKLASEVAAETIRRGFSIGEKTVLFAAPTLRIAGQVLAAAKAVMQCGHTLIDIAGERVLANRRLRQVPLRAGHSFAVENIQRSYNRCPPLIGRAGWSDSDKLVLLPLGRKSSLGISPIEFAADQAASAINGILLKSSSVSRVKSNGSGAPWIRTAWSSMS
ncbi:hypothetical protein [Phyllobacterium brassicacearum]|uniref:hypothetical protein n=1 Tax=Phyllobacterium brassicacearum TaxID=314235 RepID=UPI0010EB9095|nr:hypothetical protein [Phyllobacterium brassicacearum]TDQ13666.1 hypothetical protein DEV91_14025 [Phyllobacterium brassicacearum]